MACRPDVIMATGRSDYPNQVNNALGFPYLFRGALDVRARAINEAMKLAAVRAIASLAREPVPESICQMYGQKLSFGPGYLIPKPMDPRLITTVSMAVARAAIESGVARKPIDDWARYQEQLDARLGANAGLVRRLTHQAKASPKRVLLEGLSERVLSAARELTDEAVARPVLVGPRAEVEGKLHRCEMAPETVDIIDPAEHEAWLEAQAMAYYDARQRRGMSLEQARAKVREPSRLGLLALLSGHADALLTDPALGSASALEAVLELVPLEKGGRAAAGMHIIATRQGRFFFADTLVNARPDAETLAEIGRLAARAVRFFGVEPRVAMLSHTNFDADHDETSALMAEAAARLRALAPGLVVDGDVQPNFALRPDLMKRFYPFSPLAEGAANTFVFPDVITSTIACKLVGSMGGGELIGPILLGLERPVHVLPRGSTARDIANLAAVAVVDAQGGNEFF